MKETTTIIAARALARLQRDYPNHWQLYISEATQHIKLAKKEHNLPDTPDGNKEAISLCLQLGSGLATIATYMAAAGILNKLQQLQDDHIAIELHELHLEQEQAKIPATPWNDANKSAVSDFYARRLAKVRTTLDGIIAETIALAKSLGLHNAPISNTKPACHRHHGPNRGGAVAV